MGGIISVVWTWERILPATHLSFSVFSIDNDRLMKMGRANILTIC